MTLLESRSNIFVHGSNGGGKTTFVQDCMQLVKEQHAGSFMVYIDCVEFYSEKLIAVAASQQINAAVGRMAKKLIIHNKSNPTGAILTK